MTTTELQPLLKWAGGKRWLLPTLRELWEPHKHRRLVDPFVGGMSVALGLRPNSALLNDINPHLINLYMVLASGSGLCNIEMRNDRDLFYAHRARFNQLIEMKLHHSVEAATLFYYLNRTGFNGLCRFNNKGYFNVPFGKYKTINYIEDPTPYEAMFKQWQFVCTDFEALVAPPSAFIYADPPYDDTFTAYSAGGFTWADQERLAAWLASHPGPVVASNSATERIRDLYQSRGFTIREVTAPRRISRTGDRTPVTELLMLKNL